MTGNLFDDPEPDAAKDVVTDEGEEPVEVWCRQFVNRWVFLRDQRPDALEELLEFVRSIQ